MPRNALSFAAMAAPSSPKRFRFSGSVNKSKGDLRNPGLIIVAHGILDEALVIDPARIPT
jgi:hypothetical protein